MTAAALIAHEAPRSAAYAAGYKAIQAGYRADDNPHAAETAEHRDWIDGFDRACIQNLNFDFVRAQASHPPAWAREPIQSWQAVYDRTIAAFVTRDYWTDSGSVNVFRVIGTRHGPYQGRTWLDLLMGGKRMPHNLGKLRDNPDYYLELGTRQPRMDFYTLDGLDFYVGADGNHRTCIARFFLGSRGESQLHNVTIHHQTVDWELYRLYCALDAEIRHQGLAIRLEIDSRSAPREDTAGWKIDYHTPFLIWSDPQRDTDITLDREAARDRLIALRVPRPDAIGTRIKRFFKRATSAPNQ